MRERIQTRDLEEFDLAARTKTGRLLFIERIRPISPTRFWLRIGDQDSFRADATLTLQADAVWYRDMGRGPCMDCGRSTAGEDFMVNHALWAKHVADDGAGLICVGCLESRVGRRLHMGDFIHWPINNVNQGAKSPRLIDRLMREVP